MAEAESGVPMRIGRHVVAPGPAASEDTRKRLEGLSARLAESGLAGEVPVAEAAEE